MDGLSDPLEVELAPADKLQLEAAYDAYRERVFQWALRYAAGSEAWAEDLTHDVFLKLSGRLARLDAREDLAGWLYRVTANLAVSRLRRERSFLGLVQRLWASARGHEEEHATAHVASHAALRMLSELPDRERVVLCMKLLDGLTGREIARALSLSEGYVSKLLDRAREKVRRAGWEWRDEP